MKNIAAALLITLLAQDEKPHELHIRSFPVIWKEIEPKLAGTWKAPIAVSIGESQADLTTWLRGELFVRREEKQPSILVWKIGTGADITERAFHDGTNVIVTDERELTFVKGPAAGDPRFIAQEILLTGGRDLPTRFDISTVMDPKQRKEKRTVNAKVKDELNTKEGDAEPEGENRVDHYMFLLRPKTEALKSRIESISLQLDAERMMATAISISYTNGDSTKIFVGAPVKLDAKEIAEKKLFEFELSDTFKKTD